VCVDGLEETQGDPDVDSENVEVLGKVAVKQGSSDRARAKDEDFSGVSVLGGKTERRRILVVDFVDVLVESTSVKGLVG
jgi:hypothetical protein